MSPATPGVDCLERTACAFDPVFHRDGTPRGAGGPKRQVFSLSTTSPFSSNPTPSIMSSTTLIPHPDASTGVATERSSTSSHFDSSSASAQTAVARYLRESGWDDGSAMQRAEHLVAGARTRLSHDASWMDIARSAIEEAVEHAIRSASYNVVPDCEQRSMGPAIELRPALAMRPSTANGSAPMPAVPHADSRCRHIALHRSVDGRLVRTRRNGSSNCSNR